MMMAAYRDQSRPRLHGVPVVVERDVEDILGDKLHQERSSKMGINASVVLVVRSRLINPVISEKLVKGRAQASRSSLLDRCIG
jgi:hypothetical protein